MIFPEGLKVYGDQSIRGKVPSEQAEQIAFFNHVRKNYPHLALIATHIRNEGVRTTAQTNMHIAEGMTRGASDIIIPAKITFVCELKRSDHTKSHWQDGQKEYLKQAQENGAFACLALGARGALEALNEWLDLLNK